MSTQVGAVRGDALARADQAWSMRIGGGTWAAIAQATGYSDAANCIRAVRSVYGQLPEPSRAERRDLWRERLERLWLHGLQDVTEDRPGAVTACVRIAQAAMALDGLNEPVKIDATVTDVWTALLAEAAGGGYGEHLGS